MTPSSYLGFAAVAATVTVVPGADFAIVTRNTLTGGRAHGWATAGGVAAACVAQGALAAAGLGAVVVASQPVFHAISWAGVAYLALLALQAARSAWRGHEDAPGDGSGPAGRGVGFRQGFLSNITNPKVLVFYLAVLPQFMDRTAGAWSAAGLALTHAAISLAYLTTLVAVIDRASMVLRRRNVRRAIDGATAVALGVFSAALARAQL